MSAAYDLVVTGGQLVSSHRVFPATVAVRHGKIAGILSPDERPDAGRRLKADGLHILPGIIDSHVHLRSPGHAEREDAVSGTRAAAAGGITTILEMPISTVPANSADGLRRRAEAIGEGALVDFALYGAAGHENIARLSEIAEAGAVAFKTFLTAPPAHREGEFFGLWCLDYADLKDVMRVTASTGLRHCFHCENYPMLETLIRRLKEEGRTDGLAHAESRPAVVEDTSVAIMLAIAAETGGPVEAVHVSSPRAARLIKDARARGLDVIGETCPQYLFFTDRALAEHGGFAKCNPALRTEAEREGLWACLLDGSLDILGSDHSPFQAHEKTMEDIFQVPPGVPGLESMLPLMLTAVNQGRLSLPRLATLMSSRTAEVFALPGKGGLAPGQDADMTLVDMRASWTFDTERCFSKAKACMRMVHGMRMQGKVIGTVVRGTVVYEDGEITAEPGTGRWVRPASAKG